VPGHTLPDMDPDYGARIARLEAQLQAVLDHLGLAGPGNGAGYDAQSVAGPLPGGFAAQPGGFAAQPAAAAVPPELVAALQRGRMIEAIKIYREQTGVGLKEAKAAVEEMARDFGVR
jgi:hypothetical protein